MTFPLSPGAAIGILGGGQLGRMLALAAARLGLRCHIYAPEPDAPAFQVAAHTCADFDDQGALDGFARSVQTVTYEFENVPAETAAFLEARVPVAPGAGVLAITQDRLVEKHFVAGLGLAAAPFAEVDGLATLETALDRLGRPAILKTRRFGYDGKGQIRIEAGDDAKQALAAIGSAPAILEGLVSFTREISVIAARGRNGAIAVYDVPENEHERGILRRSRVPARILPQTSEAARAAACRIISGLEAVGAIAVEMFVAGQGEDLIVNEIAPRVHNSGHWTLDACGVSQFEQHIRAVAGWPLGDPGRHSDVTMENLLGDEAHSWAVLAAEAGACLHLYGKAETRPGRKMGHVNRLYPSTGRVAHAIPPPR